MMHQKFVTDVYEELVQAGQINTDENQRLVLAKLEALQVTLNDRKVWRGGRRGLFFKQRWDTPATGLYLWGGVGRGKTFLMDLFFDSLSSGTARRLHFHRFMNEVHQKLSELQGTENPLELIAEEFARQVKVLCFDEFFVSDIADAMILGTLLEALFRRGISLVATSNLVPENLYKDGLQRDRFLPAIKLINKHCKVVNLDSGTDYRLRNLESACLYYSVTDSSALDAIRTSVLSLAPEACRSEAACIEINRRQLPVCFVAKDVVWFDFGVICGPGRAAPDYIEVARIFHTVVITGVTKFTVSGDDMTRRWLHLIDEFYDRSVKLIIGADTPLDELCSGPNLAFEVDRCRSRLIEMQSFDYLERPHQPE
jgi:cell division protein ZapE